MKKRQTTSVKLMTRKEFDVRLRAARAEERKIKAEGKKLPSPTKKWAKKSFDSLSTALSGR